MKVNLVSALARLDQASGEPEANLGDAPLGPLMLAAILREQGSDVSFLDLDWQFAAWSGGLEGDFVQHIADRLAASNAEVFGFSSVCGSYPQTLRIAKLLKKLRPECVIVLGGPQASVVDTSTVREFPEVDFVVRGEADETFPQLLDALASGQRHLDFVPGLTWRTGSRVHRSCEPQPVADLDRLPLPAYDLYRDLVMARNISLELGRGCPFACSFCSTNEFFRRKFRLKSPEKVIEQMRVLNAQYRVRNFSLVHDMFTVDRRRVIDFCDAMKRSATGFQWSCSARTDCVDKDLLRRMADAGCDGIFYGIETGSQAVQKAIQKDLDVPQARAIVQATSVAGIPSTASAITGFPEETIADFRDTVDFLLDVARGDDVETQLHLLAPLSGTPIAKRFESELLLDRTQSDISTSRLLTAEEWSWIQQWPSIFSSFYHVPSPDLDRGYVAQASVFVRSGLRLFRWLMIALHDLHGHILDVFDTWREWSTPRGLHDQVNAFLDFAAERYQDPPVQAIIEFYRAVQEGQQVARAIVIPSGVTVVALPFNLSAWLAHMRRGTLRDFQHQDPETVAVMISGKRTRLLSLHPLQASLIGLCDGVRSYRQISDLADWSSWNSMAGVSREVVAEVVLDSLVEAGVLSHMS